MDYEQISRNFKERFKSLKKELKKKEGYTNDKLASTLDVTVNTVNKWASNKEYGNLPSWDMLGKLSQLFDVDITYLLGYQKFRRINTQRICDLSGLSEEAGNVIEAVKKNERDRYALDKLLTHNDFPRLLEAIYQYAHCHNAEIEIKDKTSSSDNYFPFTKSKKKAAFKLTATDTFSGILEDMYKENEEIMNYKQGEAELKDMFLIIHRCSDLQDDALKEQALNYIRSALNVLPKHPVYDIFKQLEPEDIFKKYKELSKTLGISLESITENPPTT